MNMRSVVLVALVVLALAIGCVAVEPEAAVMMAPQVDDVTLLQMDSQAHTTASSVASIEAELAAALASQQTLQSELEAQTKAEVGAKAEVDAEAQAVAEQQAEEAAASQTAAKTEADADAESVSELEAEFEAQAAAEVEAESSSEASTESAAEAEADSESETVVGNAVDSASGSPVAEAKPRFSQKKKAEKKEAKKGNTASFKKGELRTERSDPNGAPDVVHLPNGKKLYKSWVVSPNLKLEQPKPKPQLKHSKERVMTPDERNHFVRRATLVSKRPLSEVRKAFLRLNPEQRAKKLRARNLSPAAAFVRAFRLGKFPQLKFDPPTGGAITHQSVTQHLTVRHHSPSVRQRAEVAALRAASRTLRRINNKRHEFKKALRALRVARNGVQKQIHRHHVVRAIQARKVAARAQRRAAWSALLQHHNLRRELMRTIACALRKGHLTGEARRQAIAALIKRNVFPAERACLHAFINGQNTRKNRHAARGARAAARKAKVGKAAAATASASSKATKRVGAAAKTAAPTASSKAIKRVGASAKTAAPTASSKAIKRVGSAAPAAAAAGTQLTAKDQKAIDALIARIRAAIVAKRTARKNKNKKGKKITPIRFSQVESEAEVEAEVEAEAESESSSQAELEAAERLAAEAEAEAVAQLSMDESSEAEVQEKDELLMKTEAEAEAAAASTEEFLAQNNF